MQCRRRGPSVRPEWYKFIFRLCVLEASLSFQCHILVELSLDYNQSFSDHQRYTITSLYVLPTLMHTFLSLSIISWMMDLNVPGLKLLTSECNKWWRQDPPERELRNNNKKNKPFVPQLSERVLCPLSHRQNKESLKWSFGIRDIFQMRWNKSVLSSNSPPPTPYQLSLNPCHNSKVKESERDTSTLQ